MALLLVGSASFAQEYEYGKPEELKGLKTFWVDTGSDLNARTTIVDAIKKELPGLELVDELADSDIRIQFAASSEDVVRGATQINNSTVLRRVEVRTGRGSVWLLAKGADKTKPRLIISFSYSTVTKHPVTKFAREFIKTYKTANAP